MAGSSDEYTTNYNGNNIDFSKIDGNNPSLFQVLDDTNNKITNNNDVSCNTINTF